MSDQPEMHKSMIDGEERPGVKPTGKFESNPDENPGHYDAQDADKSSGSSAPTTGSSNPVGSSAPPSGSAGTDASSATVGAGTSADTDKKPAAGKPQSTTQIQQGQNQNPMSNANEPNQGFGGAGAQPSIGADVSKEKTSSGSEGTQGGEQPKADPEKQDNKDDKKDGAPKPLSGGSGGNSGAQTGPGGMKLPGSESQEEGTGEKWEKSTGVKADGGDFDATRPGAGKEADRLMEQAGIHHGEPKRASPDDDDTKKVSKDEATTKKRREDAGDAMGKTIPGSDPDKKGLMDKLKDKIHHH